MFKIFSAFILILSIILLGCREKINPVSDQSRLITDSAGRIIQKPSANAKVIYMRAGAVRLMAYMGLTQRIAYVEQNDLTRVVPYMMAHPELKELPLIGTGNNYDHEAIALSDAELIISTYMNKEEADILSEKTSRSVFCLNYGDMLTFKDDFYQSLKALGQLFDKEMRADSLIAYIEQNIKEVNQRMSEMAVKPTAYIGGIAFNGVHGLNSTRAQYPPFKFLDIVNPVDNLPYSFESIGMGQKNLLIDPEQLFEWNPEYIFLDAAGRPAWNDMLNKPLYKQLNALKNGDVYSLLPFNWHSINYENLLCNTWFIGKLVFPEGFKDVDVDAKCTEIFRFFYQKELYDQVRDVYHPFQKELTHAG